MDHGSLPIGVFDSGLGGLSVLRELVARLPGEDFLYLGDVARLPYGSKSHAAITRYALGCVDFLASRRIKALVIACNTATAMALPTLREKFPFPVYGVIEPAVARAAAATRVGKVLVLATPSTVRSEAYRREFNSRHPELKVEELACPLLVPLAEEGWFDHPLTVAVIKQYLAEVRERDYDVLVLGCTHYPFLESSFRQAVGEARVLVHSGPGVAVEVEAGLMLVQNRNRSGKAGRLRFFATDPLPQGQPIVQRWFGENVHFELVDL
jgi:glutamate racemase